MTLKLNILSDIPDDFKSPVPVTVHCNIPKNTSDQISQVFGISIAEKKGHQLAKLAAINAFAPVCTTFSDGSGVDAGGEISGDSGFLTVKTSVGSPGADVDQFVCCVNFLDKSGKPSQTTVAGWDQRLKFFTMVASQFKRRQDGQVGFHREWNDYENGFGHLHADFWLGLRQLNRLMYEGPQELRIELKYKNKSYYAHFAFFRVADAFDNYRLRVRGYSGNAGDSFSEHDNLQFTTIDRDHDLWPQGNCAVSWMGGWWFHNCHRYSNLNGLWGSKKVWSGVLWHPLTTPSDSATFTEMKTRPVF